MNKITPFLWYIKDAEKAAKFYCSIFKNSKIIAKNRFGQKVGSITFRINGQELTAFNGGPYFKFTPAISLFVHCKTQKEVDYYWEKLSKGGEKSRCGWLKDKYGLSWQIIPDALEKFLGGKNTAGADRAYQAMMKMSKIDIQTLKSAYNQK